MIKFQKNKFCASFPYYFLWVFLVRGNLMYKYGKLFILMDIDGSNLVTN